MKGIVSLIPCHNVEKYCRPVILEALEVSDRLILVNDGSTDSTGALLSDFQKKHPEKVIFISFAQNKGKGEALLTGMKEALKMPFQALVTLDADQQHLPEEIPLLAKPILEGKDFAVGVRDLKKMPFRSKFSNLFISKLLRFLYPHSPKDTQSGFRSFSSRFTKELVEKVSGGRYEMEFKCILLALREKIEIVAVKIATIYFENHPSYFRRIYDSLRILKVFFLHWFKKQV